MANLSAMASEIASSSEDTVSISAVEARSLLSVLCIKYGFRLPPLWTARLINNPPRSTTKFTDTVFHAEGLDPVTADSALYKSIYAEVREAFQRSARTNAPQ